MQPSTAALFAIGFSAAAIFVPAPTSAQQGQPPSRIGNIWDSQSHQPTRGEVREEEQSAGLRGSAAQERQETDEVEEIAGEVLRRAEHEEGNGMPGGTGSP
jgi:hypothetical protein